MDEENPCKCPPPGLPQWMGTFADLMSLLMCFFVLLLSFSEMDVLKFKQIAGSMKFAFGVQNRLEVKDIPKEESKAEEKKPEAVKEAPKEKVKEEPKVEEKKVEKKEEPKAAPEPAPSAEKTEAKEEVKEDKK